MDVLSSIRRLVSEDRKTGARPAAGGRLVLTKALRVPEGDAAGAENRRDPMLAWRRDAESDAGTGTGDQAGDQAGSSALEETIAELEAAVAVSGEEFEPDGGEAAARATAPMPGFDGAPEVAWDKDVAETSPDAVATAEQAMSEAAIVAEAALHETSEPEGEEPEATPDPTPGTAPEEPALAEVGAQPWAAANVDRPHREYRGIMAGYDLMAANEEPLDTPITGVASLVEDEPAVASGGIGFRHSPRARRPAVEEADLAAFSLRPRAEAVAAAPAETAPVPPQAVEAAPLAAEPADDADFVDETDALEDHERFTQAADDDAALADDAPDQTDAAPADEPRVAASRFSFGAHAGGRPQIVRPMPGADAEPEQQTVPEGLLTTAADPAGDDDMPDLFDPLAAAEIDIDHLRDMVAEIIREELRGRLGEKLTRNLRQLVRREIARALADQDPDRG